MTRFIVFLAISVTFLSLNSVIGADEGGRERGGKNGREEVRTVQFAKKTQVIAHRGANAFAPENTVPAFEKAVALGVDFVEIDVRGSKDGVNFILHDSTLDRTTTGTGNARSFDFAAIRELSAGKGYDRRFESVKVPTLEEVCVAVDHANKTYGLRTTFYVDCKDPVVPDMLTTLKKYGFLDSCIFYGSERLLLSLRKLEPQVRIMPALGGPVGMEEIIEEVKPYAFDMSWKNLTKELVDKAHAKGVKIFVDAPGNATVKELREVMDMGVDGIQTNNLFDVFEAENWE
ncbi:MAG: glycerophosphodiester phosphodiesterase [Thermoguttaceae bacterium]